MAAHQHSRPDRPAGDDRVALRQRGLRLEYATIAWNGVEVFITIGLGIAARSLALIAFGLDSLVEVFASLVVVWHMQDSPSDDLAGRNRRAMQLVSAAFAVLAVSLLVASTRNVLSGERPDSSPVGIAYMVVTALVMFTLARWKRSTGDALDSEPLQAEADMTRLDGWLATGILSALALNAGLGWWWADPLAAGVVGLVAANEARETWSAASG